MNKAKNERRLNYLLTMLNPSVDEQYLIELKKLIDVSKPARQAKKKEYELYTELFSLANILNIPKDELKEMWVANKHHYNSKYKYMPKPLRQDNKTYLNKGARYSSNANKIRYPKKCRKTAWKRFYKLFPHLKPKEENEL